MPTLQPSDLRLLIVGNVLFVLGVISYFFASPSMGIALGAFGIVLEIGGIVSLIRQKQERTK